MATNTRPIFTGVPVCGMAAISTANTNRDGTGTVATVLTAAAAGTLISLIEIVATGTTTAGVVRLFIHDGTSYRLWKEVLVSAITPSATVEVFRAEFKPTAPLALPAGYSIRASTHNAEGFNVIARGGDFTQPS